MSTVHACPAPGAGTTPCCGRNPFELPRSDRLTIAREAVTCGPWAQPCEHDLLGCGLREPHDQHTKLGDGRPCCGWPPRCDVERELLERVIDAALRTAVREPNRAASIAHMAECVLRNGFRREVRP